MILRLASSIPAHLFLTRSSAASFRQAMKGATRFSTHRSGPMKGATPFSTGPQAPIKVRTEYATARPR